MDLNDYQTEALRTAYRPVSTYPEPVRDAVRALRINGCADSAVALLNLFDQMLWCLGLAGEVGETLDLLKKSLGHGHPLDREKLKKELGDVRWYGAVLEDSLGFTSGEVAQANVEKLRARYPEGFSTHASQERADEA